MTDWRSAIQPEPIPPREHLDGEVHGCRWCGLAESEHPAEVHGLGHFHTKIRMPLGFVAPTVEIVARRLTARQSGGLPIADFNEEMGRPKTHLVRATCRCGADAVCTPERVEGARCGSCTQADAETAVTVPGYDMRESR
jgi:hypothetical protein